MPDVQPSAGNRADELVKPREAAAGLGDAALVAAGMALLAAGGVMAAVAAAALPAVVPVGHSGQPGGWLGWVAAVALIVTVALAGTARRRWHRALRSGCAVAAVLASGALAIPVGQLIPQPGPSGGIGPRGPVALVACGCFLLAGVLLLLARGPRRQAGPGRAVPWAAAAAALVVAALAGWFLPAAVAAQNVRAQPASTPAPPPQSITFSGSSADITMFSGRLRAGGRQSRAQGRGDRRRVVRGLERQ